MPLPRTAGAKVTAIIATIKTTRIASIEDFLNMPISPIGPRARHSAHDHVRIAMFTSTSLLYKIAGEKYW
jgi:hypothetical protein